MGWFGHVQRRGSGYIGRRMLEMELPGRRGRGRPKRYMDAVKEDMQVVKVEDTKNRLKQKTVIHYVLVLLLYFPSVWIVPHVL